MGTLGVQEPPTTSAAWFHHQLLQVRKLSCSLIFPFYIGQGQSFELEMLDHLFSASRGTDIS